MDRRAEWRFDAKTPSFQVSSKESSAVDKNPNLTIIDLYNSYVKLHSNSYPLDKAQINDEFRLTS
jgi:hypothetical protein